MNTINSQIDSILRSKGNKFFSITFKKRTDGKLRKMLCRTGVKKYVKGTSTQSYNDLDKGLVRVWSFDSYLSNKKTMSKDEAGFNAWRSIPIENIISCSLFEIKEKDEI